MVSPEFAQIDKLRALTVERHSVGLTELSVLEVIDVIESFDHTGIVRNSDYRGLLLPGDFL